MYTTLYFLKLNNQDRVMYLVNTRYIFFQTSERQILLLFILTMWEIFNFSKTRFLCISINGSYHLEYITEHKYVFTKHRKSSKAIHSYYMYLGLHKNIYLGDMTKMVIQLSIFRLHLGHDFLSYSKDLRPFREAACI